MIPVNIVTFNVLSSVKNQLSAVVTNNNINYNRFFIAVVKCLNYPAKINKRFVEESQK